MTYARPDTRKLLRARAPLRVSFAGGGTDVAPYPEREGGLVLSATINSFVYGTLRPRTDRQIVIQSLDLDEVASMALEDAQPSGDSMDLIKAAIHKIASEAPNGFDLFLHSAAPPGSGLGSSSAVVVALIGLLTEYMKTPLTNYEIADLALTVERKDLGLKGGAQDQYASVFGGFNFIEFTGDRVLVNPLRIPSHTIRELEYNLMLCFSGSTRVSDHIIEDQTSRFRGGDESTTDGLRLQKQLAMEMKDALLKDKLGDFGRLLDEAWQAKKRLSPRVTNDHINELYEASVGEGALGGKVTGAGGGGYILLYCPYDRQHKVEAALRDLGAEVIQFDFEHRGLVTWTHRDD